MKKQDLAIRLARQAGISRAAAADQIDREVHEILAGLRKGKPVLLPGLGALTAGGKRGVEFTSSASGDPKEKCSAAERQPKEEPLRTPRTRRRQTTEITEETKKETKRLPG